MDIKNASTNNLNNSEIKSKRNSSVPRKKSEISAATIINSLERDINDLIQETTVRTQKNKLIALNETFKLLAKKLNSTTTDSTQNLHNYLNQNPNTYSSNLYTKKTNNLITENSFSKSKNEYTPKSNADPRPAAASLLSRSEVEEELKKAYEAELKKLRENKSNEIELINSNKEKDIQIAKLTSKAESLSAFLAEEKSKNLQLMLKIKSLEESFKTLNGEYMSLNYKFNKAQTESENYEKSLLDVRKNNSETKTKFEELVKINSELKNRLVEYETSSKLHQDDLRNVLKRNANLQKNLEELEKVNKQLISDLSYKEERLRAIRLMNQKLEQKSNQILKKWDTFKRFEEKATEITTNSNRMMEVIEELNKKYIAETEEKEVLRKNYDLICNEKFQMNSLINELNNQISNLKNVNDELVNRNNSLEAIFRGNLEGKGDFGKDSARENFKSNTFIRLFSMQGNVNNSNNNNNNTSNHLISHSVQENENNNNTFGNEISLERMNPAKIIIKENNSVEIQQ